MKDCGSGSSTKQENTLCHEIASLACFLKIIPKKSHNIIRSFQTFKSETSLIFKVPLIKQPNKRCTLLVLTKLEMKTCLTGLNRKNFCSDRVRPKNQTFKTCRLEKINPIFQSSLFFRSGSYFEHLNTLYFSSKSKCLANFVKSNVFSLSLLV